MSWLFWKRIDIALSMMGEVKDKVILDFGCGGGVTFKYLVSQGAMIHACDNQFYPLAEFVSHRIGTQANIYRELSDIKGIKLDIILALDVLEHVEDLNYIFDMMLRLSNSKTILITSGPTENILYRIGRSIAGFSGHYHRRNIYDIEGYLFRRGFKMTELRKLFPAITFFRVSSWRIHG